MHDAVSVHHRRPSSQILAWSLPRIRNGAAAGTPTVTSPAALVFRGESESPWSHQHEDDFPLSSSSTNDDSNINVRSPLPPPSEGKDEDGQRPVVQRPFVAGREYVGGGESNDQCCGHPLANIDVGVTTVQPLFNHYSTTQRPLVV